MGGQGLGDRQDRIIGGFHHGGALALIKRAEKEPKKFSFFTKSEFLRRGKPILFSGRAEEVAFQNLNSYVEENPILGTYEGV
jgi:hypothetical protein